MASSILSLKHHAIKDQEEAEAQAEAEVEVEDLHSEGELPHVAEELFHSIRMP